MASVDGGVAYLRQSGDFMDDNEHHSRERRIALRQAATLVDSAGVSYPAFLTDLSSGGFRVECGQFLRIGEYVQISSGRNPALRGQIRWADGNKAGGVFLDGIDRQLG